MELFKHITDTFDEAEISEKIDECMPNYIDEDWATEFDDIYEAYDEQGRGEAESQVLGELIREAAQACCRTVPIGDEYCDLFDKLAEHWNITTD
jgi:hypothetical protein